MTIYPAWENGSFRLVMPDLFGDLPLEKRHRLFCHAPLDGASPSCMKRLMDS